MAGRARGLAFLCAGLILLAPGPAAAATGSRSFDGSGNNLRHRAWGLAGRLYLRVSAPVYSDGIGLPAAGPEPRYVSNRIFNDSGQNLFSEHDLSQWAWVWGQLIDHDIALREEAGGEAAAIGFDPLDPLEAFRNDFGSITFSRTPAAPGTGAVPTSPRQQRNSLSSYIDASSVYGQSPSRLDWMRAGPADGDPSNNSPRLLLPGGFLPSRAARGDPASAPPTKLFGRLAGLPQEAVVGGDLQANENLGLTAVETLFAREHNRVVDALPKRLGAAKRFGIARRVVGAEEQYITYNEFLPAMGIELTPYRGYDGGVNATVSNEFATAGFRLHSMVHGDFFVTRPAGHWSAEQLAAFEAAGMDVQTDVTPGRVHLAVPLFAVFGNPGLLPEFGIAPFLDAIGIEHQYRNDEQIDDNLRSVLFGVPRPGMRDPAVCGIPRANPDCFTGVSDLGAIDVARGRDHGLPGYAEMRRAYGLEPLESFAAITGEAS